MSFNLATSIVLFGGFAVAFAGVLAIPTMPGNSFTRGLKMAFAGAMGIWVLVGLSHVLQYGFGIMVLDTYENYLKVLFVPVMASASYVRYLNEQYLEKQRQAAVLSAEHDLLMRVVDTTPNAIVLIAPDGRIEFGNDRARTMLELDEDPDTGAYRTPAWRCRDSQRPGTLDTCLSDDEMRDKPCELVWPDGRLQPILLNSTPITTSDGAVSGAVVAIASRPTVSAAG